MSFLLRGLPRPRPGTWGLDEGHPVGVSSASVIGDIRSLAVVVWVSVEVRRRARVVEDWEFRGGGGRILVGVLAIGRVAGTCRVAGNSGSAASARSPLGCRDPGRHDTL